MVSTSADSLTGAVKGKLLVVGTTGETVLGRREILALDHQTYLVSASSDRWEFAVTELDNLSSQNKDIVEGGRRIGTAYLLRGTKKTVNLLADGTPINFWSSGEHAKPGERPDLESHIPLGCRSRSKRLIEPRH